MTPVWIDTDIGSDIDDAVALLCAARHPGIRLVGVSTVFRWVGARAWLARELLSRAGLGHVPVLPGASAPVTPGVRIGAPEPESYGLLAPRMPAESPADDDDRVAAIGEAMAAVGEPFHLLTIGALTNAARLLHVRPDLRSAWSGVTCMAGRLEGPAEYNVRCDPVAARTVFSRVEPRLVGLEASSNTLPRHEAEALLDPGDLASAFLLQCYRLYRERSGRPEEAQRAPLTLFDAISLLSLVQEDAFDFQPVRVLMERDGRLLLTDDGAPVHYALSSDWAPLKRTLTGLLRGAAGWQGSA